MAAAASTPPDPLRPTEFRGRLERGFPRGLASSGVDRSGDLHWSDGACTLWQSPGHGPGGSTTTCAARGRIAIFDGRLFERAAVAGRLGLSDRLSDCELACAWIDRFGLEALAALRGDFCMAEWRADERRLTLATAPMATRLIHFSEDRTGVSFSNVLPRLLTLPGVSNELDPAALALHLLRRPLVATASVYRQVRTVAPGMLAIAGDGGVAVRSFWSPLDAPTVRLPNAAAYAERARELLDQAVARRYATSVPTALSLSGGLDSAAIAASRAGADGAPLDCFTLVPGQGWAGAAPAGSYADETGPVTALAARHPNLRVHLCESPSVSAIELDPTPLFEAGGQPAIGVYHTGWFDALYRQVREAGYRDLATGAWGNFTLTYSGMPGIVDLLRGGAFGALAGILPAMARHESRSAWSLLKPALATLAPPWLQRVRGRQSPGWQDLGMINPAFAAEIRLAERLEEAGAFPPGEYGRHHLHDLLFVRRPQILGNAIAIGRHYGLKLHEPLSDQDLVEFCIGLPPEQFLLDGRPRSLARRALADRLPAALVTERRRGLQNPDWFRRLSAQRDAFVAEIAELRQNAIAAAVLDLPRLEGLIRDWPRDETALGRKRSQYQHLLPMALQLGRFIRWAGSRDRTGQAS